MASIWTDTLLSEDEKNVALMARDFAQKEIAPLAAATDKNHEIAASVRQKLGELGFMGMMVPTEYGGSGLSMLAYVSALEEVATACASTAVYMSVNNSLVCQIFLNYASEELKKYYLPRLASGKSVGCYCLTEPGAGSDASALRTRAEKKGDKYVLNGVKTFITNARESDVAIVYAMIDPSKKSKGIGAFVVDTKTKGYTVAKLEEKLGINGSSTGQIVLENCEIPVSHLIGKEEEGFSIAMATLDGGRIGIAAQAIGIARACLEEALRYSLDRQAFGKPIAQIGAIQTYLADMGTDIEAARLLKRQAAWRKDRGLPYARQAAHAKLFAAEMAMDAAVKGIQILGGYGYTREYAMERHFRDVKVTQIYEGTSEIQRIVIARHLLKEIEG